MRQEPTLAQHLSRRGINWEDRGNFRELPGKLKNQAQKAGTNQGDWEARKEPKNHTIRTLGGVGERRALGKDPAASTSHCPVQLTSLLPLPWTLGVAAATTASMISSPLSLHLYIICSRFKVWVECLIGQAWVYLLSHIHRPYGQKERRSCYQLLPTDDAPTQWLKNIFSLPTLGVDWAQQGTSHSGPHRVL